MDLNNMNAMSLPGSNMSPAEDVFGRRKFNVEANIPWGSHSLAQALSLPVRRLTASCQLGASCFSFACIPVCLFMSLVISFCTTLHTFLDTNSLNTELSELAWLWPASPRSFCLNNPHARISGTHHLVCASTWVLGFDLGSSCLCGKHYTYYTISL